MQKEWRFWLSANACTHDHEISIYEVVACSDGVAARPSGWWCELARLARTSAEPKFKILALRGYVRLVGEQESPAEKRLVSLKEAMVLAQEDSEKKLVLAALGKTDLFRTHEVPRTRAVLQTMQTI